MWCHSCAGAPRTGLRGDMVVNACDSQAAGEVANPVLGSCRSAGGRRPASVGQQDDPPGGVTEGLGI